MERQYKNAKRQPPKVKPGRLNSKFATQIAEQKVEGYEGVKPASAREIELNQRQTNPSLEGRGASPLSKIIDAMRGEKMPPPLLARLRTLDPKVLKDILKILETQGTKAYDPVGSMGTGPLRRLPTAAERKAPGFQGVAPPPGPSERLKMEAKARDLSEKEVFEAQMRYEDELRERDY